MRYYETPRVQTVKAEKLLCRLGPAHAQGYIFGVPGTNGGDDDSSDD